jgi:hypothetical protein
VTGPRSRSVVRRSLLIASLLVASTAGAGPLPSWPGWERILGDWTGGDSRGVPGSASVSGFSFHYDLENHVIVRKDWAAYPATQDRPAFYHEGLMIITPGTSSAPPRASYFDNEGHAIEYDCTVSDTAIVFVSAPSEKEPRFRLTYRFAPVGLAIRFEIAPPGAGSGFKTYAEGSGTRSPGPR